MMPNIIKKSGYVLIVLASLFFIESAIEMYVLTVFRGPQMLFYSLSHALGGVLALVFFVSALAYVLLFFYSVTLYVVWLTGRLQNLTNHIKLYGKIALFQAIHAALLISYEWWSNVLFSNAT